MTNVSVVSVYDGPRTTVSDLVGEPLAIPTRLIDMLANGFVDDVVLRDAGPNSNGLVRYDSSTPLYLGQDVEDVAEFAEIPVASGQRGAPRIAIALKKALGIRVSREMRDENRLDDVNRQIRQLVNTIVRARHRALRAALSDPSIPTITAAAAWDTTNGKPRRDFALAQEVIASATHSGAVDLDDNLAFEADTAVLPGGITPILLDNPDFLSVYKENPLADQSVNYTGKLPKQILGMDAFRSRSWPTDRVLVCERKTVGFYSDTRPLEVTNLYPEGNGPNGGPTESWRADTSNKRAIGIDQPLAACWILGVKTP